MKSVPYLVLILLFYISCESNDKVRNDTTLSLVDSLFLVAPGEIPELIDYNQYTKRFLSISAQKEKMKLFIHNEKGILNDSLTVVPAHGEKIDYLDIVLDTNEIIFLTRDELIKFDINSEKIISTKKFEDKFTQFSGGPNGRFVHWKNHLFASYLFEESLNYGLGTTEFLNHAKIVHAINKQTLEPNKSLSYPNVSVYHQGVFQPTFYEPLMAIDQINSELEVLFPVDKNLYIYDINSLKLKKTITLSLDDYEFPTPLNAELEGRLKQNFLRDHEKPRLTEIFNLNGKTLIGVRSKKENGNRLDYRLIDNKGKQVSNFVLDRSSDNTYVKGIKNQKQIFTLPNIRKFKSDPVGYPLNICILKLSDYDQ